LKQSLANLRDWKRCPVATDPHLGIGAATEANSYPNSNKNYQSLDVSRCSIIVISLCFFVVPLSSTEDRIQPFFWTWKMPFGPNFEAGWSLKYLLGLEDSKLGQQCDPKSSNENVHF